MFKRTKVCTGLMLAFGGTLGLGALPAFSQQQQQLEKVEITGSSIRRLEADTALPVTVIRKEEIARSGAISTEQLLQSISAVSSQGGISGAIGAGNSTYGQSSISLRGLGEDRTLILVNGRRLAAFSGGNGASVDINSIPLAAIERVEILKDGASGVYGSDAIAGVVNFILTKDFNGIELGATLGTPTRSGGGKSQKAYVVGGFGDLTKDRFNITLSAAVEKETALFAKDRSFARTGNIPPFVSAAATGQGNIEGAYNPGNGTPYSAAAENATQFIPGTTTPLPPPGNTPGRRVIPNPAFPATSTSPNLVLFGNSPGAGYGNPLAASNQCETISMYLDATNTTKGAPFCTFDSNGFVGLIPKRELSTFSGNLTFKVTDGLELFGDGLYSKSKVTQIFQPSPVRRSFLVTDSLFASQGIEPALLIRPTNPNYAVAAAYLTAQEAANPGQGFGALVGQTLAVTSRVFDFGNRTSLDTNTQYRVTGGLRGNLFKQDWEIAATQNQSKLAGTVPDGYFSQVAFARVVNAPGSDYNPWSLQQSAAFNTALAASGAKYTGSSLDAVSKATGIDGKVSGEIAELPAGPLLYAVGAQGRIESFVTKPSPAQETGDIAGLGGATPPVDRERKIASVFGELNVPIIKGLDGNVAARWDKYSVLGSSTNYKAALRFQPFQELTLRGSVGTGFRAPTLVDLFQPQVLGSSEQFNDDGPGGTGQTDLQVNSLTGGNPTLKPEKARQYTFGIVAQPSKDATITVDYFNARVKDIISTPSAQEVVSRFRSGDPAFAGLVTLTGNDIDSIIQTLLNVGDAKVQGIDLEGTYRVNFASSRLDWYMAGTYMIQFDQTSPGGALSRKVGTTVDPNGNPVLSTNGVNDGVILRWKHYLSATWTTGPWAATFAQNYYRGYRDGNDLNGSPHYVGDQAIYDANVAFTGVPGLKLALGVKNLFDKQPPVYIPTSNQFQAGYDITQYDPRGRFVYVTAGYKF